MFKQQYRLPSGTRLPSQQTIATPFFLLKKAGNNLQVSRFGFVVSKKVDQRAVVRNRTRRVLRSVIEEIIDSIQPGFDTLFILKKPIEKRSEGLDNEVKQALERGGLLKS